MPLDLTIENEVALIKFDDGKVNAVGFALINALNAALDKAETESKAVVLYGGHDKFCGGFDLTVMKTGAETEKEKLVSLGGQLVSRMYSYPKPLIIAAEGHSIALGAIFLMAADLRIGKNSQAKYGLNETAIGMVLPPFGMELAKARLSLTSQTEALLFSKIYDGSGAVKAGFLDEAVSEERVLPNALEYAAQLKTLPQDTYANAKLQLRKTTIKNMAN